MEVELSFNLFDDIDLTATGKPMKIRIKFHVRNLLIVYRNTCESLIIHRNVPVFDHLQ